MEFDDDLDQEVEEPEAPPVNDLQSQLDYWQKKAQKADKEAHGLRTRLRRTEMTAKYGEDIVELIDEDLPLKKQEALAERLAERLRSNKEAQASQANGSEEPTAAPTEDELKLAAATGGPATGTSPALGQLSGREILELGLKDPARAMQEIQAKYRTP